MSDYLFLLSFCCGVMPFAMIGSVVIGLCIAHYYGYSELAKVILYSLPRKETTDQENKQS